MRLAECTRSVEAGSFLHVFLVGFLLTRRVTDQLSAFRTAVRSTRDPYAPAHKPTTSYLSDSPLQLLSLLQL